MTVQHTIGFFAPSNATAEQVTILLTDIKRYYGVADATVTPTAVAAAQGAAPAPTTLTANAPAQTIDMSNLDSEGVPYDERIHAKTKTQTAKGVWKKAKGVDETYYNSVKAQLLAAVKVTPNAAPVTPPAPTTPAAPQLPSLGAPALPQFNPFQKLMADVGKLVDANVINNDWLDQIAAYVGVSGGFVNLAHVEPAVIDNARAAIQQALGNSGHTL